MANAFIEFVKEYRKKNPSLSYKEAMVKASKEYKKDGSSTKSKPKVEAKSKPKLKGGISMVITEDTLSKKDRAKKVKQFKKVKTEIDANLKNLSLIPKQYTLFQTLGKELSGNSKKNVYARSLQQVVRKLGTKKYSILKQKLEKASPESTALLLAEQKASNVKRTTKTAQKYSDEQNRENRLRKKVANKIEAFKKNPDNKGKNVPRSKFTREADKEVDEELTKSIETTIKKIEGKKKGSSGVGKGGKAIVVKKTTTISPKSTPEDPPTKKLKPLTEPRKRIISEYEKQLTEVDKDTIKDSAEALYRNFGSPSKSKIERDYKKLLNHIKYYKEATDEDNEDLKSLEKIYEYLLDNFLDVKEIVKPKKVKPPAPPPLPSVIPTPPTDPTGDPLARLRDLATSPPTSATASKKKSIKKGNSITDKDGKKLRVPKTIVDAVNFTLNKLKEEGNYGKDKNNLTAQSLRQRGDAKVQTEINNPSYDSYEMNKYGGDSEVFNAIIDDYEKKQFGEVVSSKRGSASVPSSPAVEGETARQRREAGDIYKAGIYTQKGNDFVEGKTNDIRQKFGAFDNYIQNSYPDGIRELKQPEKSWLEVGGIYSFGSDISKRNYGNVEKTSTILPELFNDDIFEGLKALRDDGELYVELENGDEIEIDGATSPEFGGTNGFTFTAIQARNFVVSYLNSQLDKPKTSGEGFANEDITNLNEVKSMSGAGLVSHIQNKLINKNTRIKKDTKISPEHKGYAKMSVSSYVKPDNRKDIDDFVYLANQSDEENAVYINTIKKKIIIAFRGSAKLKDLSTDLSLALGRLNKTSRFKSTDNLVDKLKTIYPSYQIELTGHSLGGSLAIDMSEKHNIPSVVFNAGHSVGNNVRDKDITFYTREGDPVSMLGANSYKDVRLITGDKKGHKASHSLQNFLDEEDANKVGGSFMGDAGKALFGNHDTQKVMLGQDPSTYTPLKNLGGSLVDKMKNGLTSYAKSNSKVKKALLIKDVYNLAKEIKHDGFKKKMLDEVAKIAMELI